MATPKNELPSSTPEPTRQGSMWSKLRANPEAQVLEDRARAQFAAGEGRPINEVFDRLKLPHG
ncbi:MAG TPA: hypothetical protein VMR77_02430 [Patescibacteria group bacterium]|jgi:hypothetical protein|nr:hypothetical protein [Patescibacteria group bacterium]